MALLWKLPLELIRVSQEGKYELVHLSSCWDPSKTGVQSREGSLPQDPGHHVEKANIAWNAIAASISTVLPQSLTGLDLRDPINRDTAVGLYALYQWSYNSIVGCGYRWWLNRLKSIKSWALYHACQSRKEPPALLPGTIGAGEDGVLRFPWARGHLVDKIVPNGTHTKSNPGDLVRQNLSQLYLFGRALPFPTKDKVIASLKQHVDDMRREYYCSQSLLDLSVEWAKEWGRECAEAAINKKIVASPVMFSTLTASSSIGANIKGGGRVAIVGPILQDYTRQVADVFYVGNYYSCFGELKIRKEQVERYWDGKSARIPFNELYLDDDEIARGILNENFLLRDLCLYTMEHRVVSSGPKAGLKKLEYSGTKGCSGPGPFKGQFEKPPDDFKIKFNWRYLVARGIPERGDKCRVITVSEWEDTTIMNFPRIALYYYAALDVEIPSLDRENSESKGFGNPLMFSVNQFLRQEYGDQMLPHDVIEYLRDLEIMSLDLSRCSDLILPQLSKGLLTGFSVGTGLINDPFFNAVFDFCETAKTDIEYPEIEDYVTDKTGGPLMGDSPTWFIDNAYTKFISWLARALSELGSIPENIKDMSHLDVNIFLNIDGLRELLYNQKLLNDRFRRRCGDDEIAYDTPKSNDMVMALYPAVGGKVSEGTNFCSPHFGVYCEEFIRLGPRTRWYNWFEYSDIVRIKNITRPDAARFAGAKEIPPEWTRGFAAYATLTWFKWDSPEFQNAGLFVYLNNRKFINDMIGFQHHPFLCGELGGMGYPDINNRAYSDLSDDMKVVITWLANSQGMKLIPPSMHLELGSLSGLFSLESAPTPYSDGDALAMENMLHILSQSNLYKSISDVYLMDSDCRGDTWKLNQRIKRGQPVELTDGSGHVYVSMVSAMGEIRTRLINRRGMSALVVNQSSLPSLPSLGRKLKAWYKGAMKVSDTNCIFQPCDDRDCIKKAVMALRKLQEDTWVRYDLIDTHLPILSKGIPITGDAISVSHRNQPAG